MSDIPEYLLANYVRTVHLFQGAFVLGSNVPLKLYTKGFGRGKSVSASRARGFMHESRLVQRQENSFAHATEARLMQDLLTATTRAGCPIPEDIRAAINFALLINPKKRGGHCLLCNTGTN